MTHENETWTIWHEHCGKCLPVRKGTLGEAKLRCGIVVPFRAGCGSVIGGPYVRSQPEAGSAWVWGSAAAEYRDQEVVFYRYRQFRGQELLREIALWPDLVEVEAC